MQQSRFGLRPEVTACLGRQAAQAPGYRLDAGDWVLGCHVREATCPIRPLRSRIMGGPGRSTEPAA